MKQLLILIICPFIYAASYAQVFVPYQVKARLGTDRSFNRYAFEMMKYIKEAQADVLNTPKQKKYYEKQEKALARQLWWLEGRQDSNGNIVNSTEKVFDAINNDMSRIENTESANGAWTSVGPTNNVASSLNPSRGIGRVDRFAFHPTDANTIYAGTPSGGLWKTTNGGTNWAAVNSFMPNMSISGIVINWDDPNTIYVLTGDGDSNGGDNYFVQGFDYIRPSIGVLKSTDGGFTWRKTGSLGISGFYTGYKLIQSPTNPNNLIAATSEGLYRTIDAGESWSLVSPTQERYFDVEWKPGNSFRVYAATKESFYISNNTGASFTNADDNFQYPIAPASRIAIAVTPANPEVVYVFAGHSSGGVIDNKGIFKSTNSGSYFARGCKLDELVNSPLYMHNLAASPTNADVVIIGTITLFKSTTGAFSCPYSISQTDDASLSNFAHADVHDVAFNPLNGHLFIGTDGGVHKSTDEGESFTTCYNLGTTQFYHFDVSESDNDIMLGGSQDNGIHLRPGATSVFSHFTSGDGYACRFYPNSTGPAYFSVNKRLYKTNTGLTSYTDMTGIPDDWYKTIAISYFNNSIAYTSSGSVYKTTDGGTSWTDKGAKGRWALITSETNSNRIYAAGGNGWNDGGLLITKKLQRSDDAGENWVELQYNPGMPANITKITGIALSQVTSSHVWVTMGGFTDGEKVYFSSDAGANWTNRTGSLPNVPVNCVAVAYNGDVYIGTDIGVFFRTSAMTDWQPFLNFLPRIPVTELVIRTNTIYASTFGRGIWKSETHSTCEANLTFTTNQFGYRFYEAQNINSSSAITGGISTEIYYKAQDGVTLTEDFRASASSGEGFRAWIADCNSGGIPAESGIPSSLRIENDMLLFEMPFDGKASLIITDESGITKSIISENENYQKGLVRINKLNIRLQKGKLMLIIDGVVSGTVQL